MDTGVYISLKVRVFSSYMPWNGVAGSCGNSIFDFFKENELCINSLTIISDAGNFNLSIVFSEICFDFQTQIYESLCRNAEVFFEDKENNQLQVQKNNLNKSFITQKNENKIGQIQKADGTVFEFYKDENGKIRRRIK